jgi:hypothetical protein
LDRCLPESAGEKGIPLSQLPGEQFPNPNPVATDPRRARFSAMRRFWHQLAIVGVFSIAFELFPLFLQKLISE